MRFLIILTLSLAGCARDRTDSGPNSAAYKAGEVAHDLSKEAGKAAKAAGRELRKDAVEAHEGWKAASREDRAKRKAPER